MRPETLVLALLLAFGVASLMSIAKLDTSLAQIYVTIALAVFNLVFIATLFWDRLTDTPNLEIKMDGETEIVGCRYPLQIRG